MPLVSTLTLTDPGTFLLWHKMAFGSLPISSSCIQIRKSYIRLSLRNATTTGLPDPQGKHLGSRRTVPKAAVTTTRLQKPKLPPRSKSIMDGMASGAERSPKQVPTQTTRNYPWPRQRAEALRIYQAATTGSTQATREARMKENMAAATCSSSGGKYSASLFLKYCIPISWILSYADMAFVKLRRSPKAYRLVIRVCMSKCFTAPTVASQMLETFEAFVDSWQPVRLWFHSLQNESQLHRDKPDGLWPHLFQKSASKLWTVLLRLLNTPRTFRRSSERIRAR